MIKSLVQNIRAAEFLAGKGIRRLPLNLSWRLFKYLADENITVLDGKLVTHSYLPVFPSRSFERYINSIKSLSEGKKIIPQVLIMSVTDDCCYNCYHCSNNFPKKPANPTTADLKRIINEFIQAGVFKIGFSGGEPFLRDDLEELTRSASLDCQVMINTTGFNASLKKLKKLKEAGLMGTRVSLDHFDQSRFDEMRGYPGAFNIALECIANSLKAGLYVSVAFVPTREMIDEKKINKFIDLVESLGAHEITIFEPKPAGKLINYPPSFFLNQKEKEFLASLHRKINRDKKRKVKILSFLYLEGEGMLGCTGGSLNFYTEADGSVCPCLFYPFFLGNVLKESLDAILTRSHEIFNHPKRYCLAFKGNGIIIKKQGLKELKELSAQFQALPDFYAALMKK